jgi:hypothetical protein
MQPFQLKPSGYASTAMSRAAGNTCGVYVPALPTIFNPLLVGKLKSLSQAIFQSHDRISAYFNTQTELCSKHRIF